MAINYGSLQATLTPRGVVSGKVQNATRAFVKDYDVLDNKPKINGVELSGDKSLNDLGIEIPEIVANPDDTTENLTSIRIDGVNYNIQGSGGSAVTSVNGKTGDVNLDAEDVGALPDDTPIPSELADLSEDSTHRTVTDTEKTAWNAKADISDLPTVNNSTITIQKNNQNVDSFTLNQDSNKSINISVPTKTSDLQNDNSFITNTVNNLANYYLKSQTYTQAEVDALIQATVNGRFQKVNTLPASGELNVIYLVPKTTPETSNACDEYIWQDNAWELIGSTEIDLSDYVTDEDLATALQSYLTTSAFATAIANYYTKTEVGTLLDNKVDKVNGKGLSTYDYDSTAKGIVDNVTTNLANKVDKIPGKGLSTNDYDNTAKAIVDSVTANLATKVDKVAGKGLSTNDYDNTAKGIVDGVTNALAGKVDKVNGKGLSTEDYTTAEKSKLGDISDNAKKVASSSTNGHIEIDDVDTTVYDDTAVQTAIENIEDELSTDYATVEGNPINFSTKSAQNAESTILTCQPIQDLHGYDKPWVGGAGANKWDEDYEQGNLNWDTGLPTSSTNYLRSKNYCSITSGANLYVVKNGYTVAIFFYDSSYALVGKSTGETVTVPATAIYFKIRIGDGTTTMTTETGIAVNYPSTVTTYSPYSNECPISGRTEIGILGCGKNLFDKNSTGIESNKGLDRNTGETTSVSSWSVSDYICVNSNTIYYLTNSASSTAGIVFCYYDKNKNYLNLSDYKTDEPRNVTTPNSACYVRFEFRTSSIDTCQFEQSSSATDYEPYTKSNDLTISLGQTVYGGTLDVENGVLTVDKARQKISDLTWTSAAGNYAKFTTNSLVGVIKGSDTEKVVISELYKSEDNTTVPANQNHIYANSGGQVKIWDDAYASSDTSGWLTARGDSYICYELATPITINLTPNQISLLEGVNNISTTGDKITLTYRDGKVATLGDLLEVEKKIPSATSQHNYSTEEQVVGTWIDGKYVYEKTVTIGSIPGGTSNYLVDTGITNASEIINIITMLRSNDNYFRLPLALPTSVESYAIYQQGFDKITGKLRINSVENTSIDDGFTVIQYTKTTDT